MNKPFYLFGVVFVLIPIIPQFANAQTQNTTITNALEHHLPQYMVGNIQGQGDGQLGIYNPPQTCKDITPKANQSACVLGYNLGYKVGCNCTLLTKTSSLRDLFPNAPINRGLPP